MAVKKYNSIFREAKASTRAIKFGNVVFTENNEALSYNPTIEYETEDGMDLFALIWDDKDIVVTHMDEDGYEEPHERKSFKKIHDAVMYFHKLCGATIPEQAIEALAATVGKYVIGVY